MAIPSNRLVPPRLHPLHGLFLAATVPLFLGSLLSDMAYAMSYQIQWTNFASWLITGGLFFGGCALLWAIATLVFSARHSGFTYPILLTLTWLLGFINALVHAKDAWASMPAGAVLSAIVFVLACASTWIGLARFGVGGKPSLGDRP